MRDRIIRIRTTPIEYDQIKATASALNLSMSELLRRSGMKVRMPPRLFHGSDAAYLARVLSELGRVGGNLNQAIRHANSGRLSGHSAELSRTLSEIDALRFSIRKLFS